MSSADDAKTPRPLTEYNIFFQLERAHILQVHLSCPPDTLDQGCEAFHPAQPSYAGLPPLPRRYASLTLPYDWHLPGKEKRRKRKHRKTHGRIGFHELSHKIATAWKNLDDAEIRQYCTKVYEAGVARYKEARKEEERRIQEERRCQEARERQERMANSMMYGNGLSNVARVASDDMILQEHDVLDGRFRAQEYQDVARRTPPQHEPFDARISPATEDIFDMRFQEEAPPSESPFATSTDDDTVVTTNKVDRSKFNLKSSRGHDVVPPTPPRVSEVDMEDDEIMHMWNNDRTPSDCFANRRASADQYHRRCSANDYRNSIDARQRRCSANDYGSIDARHRRTSCAGTYSYDRIDARHRRSSCTADEYLQNLQDIERTKLEFERNIHAVEANATNNKVRRISDTSDVAGSKVCTLGVEEQMHRLALIERSQRRSTWACTA